MSHVELPRALEDYFAFAETERSRKSRRFCITLPYLEGTRIDRLQWWYQVDETRERLIGEHGLTALHARAAERFSRHIERWLQNTGQRLYGDGPIPLLGAMEAPPAAAPAAPVVDTAAEPASAALTVELTAEPAPADASAGAADSNVVPWPKERVANG